MTLLNQEATLSTAAAKAGMDERTARKYRRLGKLPSEVRRLHDWQTRPDPFAEVWDEVRAKLEATPGRLEVPPTAAVGGGSRSGASAR